MPLEDIATTFAATFIGLILGIPIAFWIDRKIGERKQKENLASVLAALKEEINRNVNLLKQIQKELAPNTIIYYNLDVNTWKSVRLQEFESSATGALLRKIYRIYYEYEHLNRKIDMQFSMHYSTVRIDPAYPNERANIVTSILTHSAQCQKESEELTKEIDDFSKKLNGDTVGNEANNTQIIDNKREHLANMFQVALVLLGILAAAELQYATALRLPEDPSALQGILSLREFTFRITTIPFIILILAWLVIEIVIKGKNDKAETTLKLFCWNFWSFTLYVFLVLFYSFNTGTSLTSALSYIAIFWILSMLLVVMISYAYSNIYSSYYQKEYRKTSWYKWAVLTSTTVAILVFFGVAVLSLLSFGYL